MAAAATTKLRSLLLLSRSSSPLSLLLRLPRPPPSRLPTESSNATFIPYALSYRPSTTRPLCTTSETPNATIPKSQNPKLTNFSLSDSDSDQEPEPTRKPATERSSLPPPYDPFNKKPVVEEPDDPTNLQEVFHKMRTGGLFNDAVKMFDGLSKDGLTHEALELFKEINEKGHMPDVVAHTAVIEAYVNAGKAKEALRLYKRMLGGGVMPNAYTYSVLVKGLVGCGDGKMVEEGRRVVGEMVGKGVRVNAGTWVALLEGAVREGGDDRGREVVEEIQRHGGVLPEEREVREVLKGKRGPVVRSVMSLLFGK